MHDDSGSPTRLPIPIPAIITGLALTTLILYSCCARPERVAQVGETAITAQDLAYRQAVLAIHSGDEVPAYLALFQLLEEALMADSSEAIIHYNLACYWSLAGNSKLALAYLSRAFELDSSYRDFVAKESDFDPIRSHPDFQALTSVIV